MKQYSFRYAQKVVSFSLPVVRNKSYYIGFVLLAYIYDSLLRIVVVMDKEIGL